MVATPDIIEKETLECIGGPLCGRKFKLRTTAEGLSLNTRLRQKYIKPGMKDGVYMKGLWRRGRRMLIWTELPRALG
jgi:hypothetical protein